MSTASGNMSKKFSWYRSMCDKIDKGPKEENRELEPAGKIVINEKKPKLPIIEKKKVSKE